MTREKVVSIYGDSNAAVNDPNYLATLQGEIGLNRIIMGGSYNLSAKARALNPALPGGSIGLSLSDDDSLIRKAIEAANKRGIQVWFCTGGYHGGAELYPDLEAITLAGKRMHEYPKRLYAHEQGSSTFCPSNDRINDWYEAALAEIGSDYGFEGSAITHARYCHPAFIEQLLGCGCPSCQKKAKEYGYDFPSMKAAVLGSFAALKAVPVEELRTAAKVGLGFVDFLEILGKDAAGVADWFNFRADVISNNFKRYADAIHVRNPAFRFGSDTHYPTMALLVGHRYKDLGLICDQILPLLSHNEIHFMDNVGSFANFLRESDENLDEMDAVSLVYNLLGVHTPGMPRTVQAMNLGTPVKGEIGMEALQDLVANEMYKTRLMSGKKVLSYPVIKGSTWPEKVVRCLMEVALQAGHDGIVLQGTDSLFKPKK